MRTYVASQVGGRRGTGVNLDAFAAPPSFYGSFLFLDGQEPWEMVAHALAFIGQGPCPVCRGEPLGRSESPAPARDPLDAGPLRRRWRSRKS